MNDEGDGGSTLNSAVLPWTVSSPIFGALLGAPLGGVFVAGSSGVVVPEHTDLTPVSSLLACLPQPSAERTPESPTTNTPPQVFLSPWFFNGADIPVLLLPPWTFPAHSVGPSLVATPWRGVRGLPHQVFSFQIPRLWRARSTPLFCLLAVNSRVDHWEHTLRTPVLRCLLPPTFLLYGAAERLRFTAAFLSHGTDRLFNTCASPRRGVFPSKSPLLGVFRFPVFGLPFPPFRFWFCWGVFRAWLGLLESAGAVHVCCFQCCRCHFPNPLPWLCRSGFFVLLLRCSWR